MVALLLTVPQLVEVSERAEGNEVMVISTHMPLKRWEGREDVEKEYMDHKGVGVVGSKDV